MLCGLVCQRAWPQGALREADGLLSWLGCGPCSLQVQVQVRSHHLGLVVTLVPPFMPSCCVPLACIQVVAPYDSEDARGLLKAAVRDPDPVRQRGGGGAC